jgi:uncharacterized protein involved in outer membrane biogenesis
MNLPASRHRRLLPRSLAARIALGGVLALAGFACVFDWNWCRPLIQRYVMSHSGRSITFDDLQVHWRHGLDPTIELRGLTIQNAPWAASWAPFIHAGHVAATLSWRSLGSDMAIVDLVELDDAQVDMERRADGIRNWRVTRPDDRGPPRVRVLALRARNSDLHTIHEGIGLEMDVSTKPLENVESVSGHPDLPLTARLRFKGRFRDDAFEGDARVSDVLAFGDSQPRFALRLEAHSGSVTLEASGLSNDVRALGDLDCDIRLSAAAGGPARPLPAALARLRPLVAQGHLARSGDTWRATEVRIRAGRQTSLVAEATFTSKTDGATPRRRLQAMLHDALIDVDDLSMLRDKTPPGEPTLPGTRPDADHALSTRTLPFERLRELDADVDLRQARFTGAERGMAQSLRGHATLAGGVLRLSSLDIGVADGHVSGTLDLDATQAPAALALELRARGLRIEQLSATLAANGALAGAVDGQASVKTRGTSSRALVAGASGRVTLALADGASVSKRLDAKLGLDGGEWLRTLFDKSARVPVQCASVTLALEHGVATPRRFVFETPGTALAASGSLDLVGETVDATLTPVRKRLALLSLDKSIHAQGSWHAVKIALKPPLDIEPARCAR